MSFYHQLISEATGVKNVGDLEAIEDLMRITYRTLDGLTRSEFCREARLCWKAIQQMQVGS